jgi:hypothetical protein
VPGPAGQQSERSPRMRRTGNVGLHECCTRLCLHWSESAPGRIRTCGLLLRRQIRSVCRGSQPSTGCQRLESEHAASLAISGRIGPLQSKRVHRGMAGEFWMTCDTVVTLAAASMRDRGAIRLRAPTGAVRRSIREPRGSGGLAHRRRHRVRRRHSRRLAVTGKPRQVGQCPRHRKGSQIAD